MLKVIEINKPKNQQALGKGVSNINIEKNKATFSMPNDINVYMFSAEEKSFFSKKDFFRSIKPYEVQNSKQVLLNSNKKDVCTLILIESNHYHSKITKPIIKNNTLHYTKDGKKHSINLN